MAGRLLLSSNRTQSFDDEVEILTQAICMSSMPKLTQADSKRFEALLKDIFSKNSPSPSISPQLESSLIQAAKQLHLTLSNKLIEKIYQFQQALDQRMGVVLVGPPRSGKSTIWSLLMAARNSDKAFKTVKTFTINPKSVPR
jgi:dynein heavy chain 2